MPSPSAGLLNQEIGGPSVFPYQPPGLWEELSRGETFTAQEYHESHGPDLYRRSMYTFWKRTVAAGRAQHLRRARPRKVHLAPPHHQHAAAGPGPAQRPHLCRSRARPRAACLLEAGSDAAARVRFLFREATARAPRPPKSSAPRPRAARTRSYKKDPAQAAKLIAVGASKPGNVEAVELAAWTTVASTILNLDETITKE